MGRREFVELVRLSAMEIVDRHSSLGTWILRVRVGNPLVQEIIQASMLYLQIKISIAYNLKESLPYLCHGTSEPDTWIVRKDALRYNW